MRLTRTRVLSQVFFVGLFLWLFSRTDFQRIGDTPVSLFLGLDPLIAVGTTLATRSLYRGLILSLAVLLPTIFLGRFFCGWVCPFGALHQAMSRLLRRSNLKERIRANRYRRAFAVKYYVLAVFLILPAFGITQVGLLDPISLLTRSLAASVSPGIRFLAGGGGVPPRVFRFAWLSGGVFILLLALNAVIPRFFCRVICPLGALLGVISRLSIFHVHRSDAACIHCDWCTAVCPSAADPQEKLRKSECFTCLNCREICPTDAISFRTIPPERCTLPGPDVSRRRILAAGIVTACALPLLRVSTRTDRQPPSSLIRPPGACPESEFLKKCIKCGACMKVCPTNVIQPALHEAGLEGVWTPMMVYPLGYCATNCTLCGQVCPTGALRNISVEEKLGQKPFAKPIKLGTAFVDRTRCLPWAMNTPCIVCEEMCPVSPKAIYLEEAEVVNSRGERILVKRPVVDPARCIGCGQCENNCPVFDKRAIRVSSVGESRSEQNVLLLR